MRKDEGETSMQATTLRRTGACLSLLAAAAAMAVMAATARADDEDGGRFYMSARGGFNWNLDQRLVGRRNGFLARDDTHNGWMVGGAIGYDLDPLRIEIEYLHRNNDLDIVTVTNDGGLAGDLGLVSPQGPNVLSRGHVNATSMMANAILELNRSGGLRPFFGLGGGFVDIDSDAILAGSGQRLIGGDDVVLGLQTMAGVAVKISRNLSAEIGYRYLVTDKAQLTLGENRFLRRKVKDHGLLFGITWRFGGSRQARSAAPVPQATPAPAPTPAPAAVNRPPIARDDRFSAIAGQETRLDPLANDRDPDRSALTFLSIDTPAHGTLRRAGGALYYTPEPTFRGEDRFAYRVGDGHGGEATATITVDVVAPEVGPYLVFFDFDSAAVKPEAEPILDRAAKDYRQYGFARIRLVGHADRAGPDWYNDRLSLRRAEAVKKALAARGIPADAMVTIGKGEREPLVPTEDGVREPQNRRVEILIED